MVQFFRGAPDPRKELVGQLGSALGMGLGNALTTYQANKSLEDVLNNKEYSNLPTSEKMGKLEQALRPYGETGQRYLAQRLAVEQQRNMEQQQKSQDKQAKEQSKVLGKLLNNQPVSEEERSMLSPEQQIAFAKHQAAINKQPKLPVSQQPIDPDQLKRIKDTRELPEFQNASPTKKYQMLTENGVSSPLAEAESKISAEEQKIKEKGELTKRKEEIEFHKESQKYDEDLLKKTVIAKKQIDTIKDIDKALNTGNVRPTSISNLFKGFGKIGNKISEAYLNKDEATLLSSIPQLLEGWKEVFGVRLSDADLKVLQDKLPSIGKDKEANKVIINVMKKYAQDTLLRSKIAESIKKENKGLRPLDYASTVEKRYDEMTQQVEVINPNTGKKISIPAYQLSDAIKKGARLANE